METKDSKSLWGFIKTLDTVISKLIRPIFYKSYRKKAFKSTPLRPRYFWLISSQVTVKYHLSNFKYSPTNSLFSVSESILIFVGQVIRTLFLAGKLSSFSLSSLWEWFHLKVRFSADPLVPGDCQMKPEFLGVYQHREEFLFPRSLWDTELEENSHRANKKKSLYFSPKKTLDLCFSTSKQLAWRGIDCRWGNGCLKCCKFSFIWIRGGIQHHLGTWEVLSCSLWVCRIKLSNFHRKIMWVPGGKRLKWEQEISWKGAWPRAGATTNTQRVAP